MMCPPGYAENESASRRLCAKTLGLICWVSSRAQNVIPTGQSGAKLLQRSHGLSTTFGCRRKLGDGRWIVLSHASRALTAILAALDVCVIPIARDQQDRVVVTIGKHSLGRDFASIIDVIGE